MKFSLVALMAVAGAAKAGLLVPSSSYGNGLSVASIKSLATSGYYSKHAAEVTHAVELPAQPLPAAVYDYGYGHGHGFGHSVVSHDDDFGYSSGLSHGYNTGYTTGYNSGFKGVSHGYNPGYNAVSDGYKTGYNAVSDGYNAVSHDYNTGYSTGYDGGFKGVSNAYENNDG
jgi:hypothetical protein